ncbi:MAG: hypothetical protein ACYC3S_01055 [Chloroflexota bacterium]
MTEAKRQASGDETPPVAPTGGVKLAEGRWSVLSSQWAILNGQIRTMDAAELGETEPSVLFGWRGERS